MGMFIKLPRHRIFDYTPQFYKTEEDESKQKKKKLGFRKQIKTIRRRKRSPIIWIILAIVIFLVYLKIQSVN